MTQGAPSYANSQKGYQINCEVLRVSLLARFFAIHQLSWGWTVILRDILWFMLTVN